MKATFEKTVSLWFAEFGNGCRVARGTVSWTLEFVDHSNKLRRIDSGLPGSLAQFDRDRVTL